MSFGDLRSLLQRRPSQSHFDEILALIDAAQGAHIEAQWIPYAREALRSWPASVCVCPQARLGAFEREPQSWTSLVRGMEYTRTHLNTRRMERILSARHLGHVSHIGISATRMAWEDVTRLIEQSPFETLTSLALRRSARVSREELEALFLSDRLRDLEVLSLAGWLNMKAFAFEVLSQAPWREQLTSLDLTGCPVSRKRLDELLDSGTFGRLARFRLERYSGYENIYKGCLASVSGLPAIQHLTAPVMTPADADGILGSPRRGVLTSLRLDVVWSCDAFVRRFLASAQEFGSLRSLGLMGGWVDASRYADTGIRDETLVELLGALSGLERFALSSPHIQAAGLEALAASSLGRGLAELELHVHKDQVERARALFPGPRCTIGEVNVPLED